MSYPKKIGLPLSAVPVQEGAGALCRFPDSAGPELFVRGAGRKQILERKNKDLRLAKIIFLLL